jgi:carbon storage regulator
MLVLTRKSNQSIMIGDNIEVSVLAIMGEKVRIGIQADRTVPVFRKEVYLEIQAEQQEAASPPEADPAAPEDDRAAQNGRREVDAALRSLGKPE